MILAVASALTFSGALLGTFRDILLMTKHDSALYPGEYFLERRDKLDGKWELSSRDNDVDVMRTRFEYWKSIATPGQGVRLFAPNCTLVEEFIPEVVA